MGHTTTFFYLERTIKTGKTVRQFNREFVAKQFYLFHIFQTSNAFGNYSDNVIPGDVKVFDGEMRSPTDSVMELKALDFEKRDKFGSFTPPRREIENPYFRPISSYTCHSSEDEFVPEKTEYSLDDDDNECIFLDEFGVFDGFF
ncbi:hypothetical protein MIMGU_mgv11b023366mg, partial [Erythranthe guttata]